MRILHVIVERRELHAQPFSFASPASRPTFVADRAEPGFIAAYTAHKSGSIKIADRPGRVEVPTRERTRRFGGSDKESIKVSKCVKSNLQI